MPGFGSHHLLDYISSARSEEHTSELQSRLHLVCRLLLEKKKTSAHSAQVHAYLRVDACLRVPSLDRFTRTRHAMSRTHTPLSARGFRYTRLSHSPSFSQ